MSGSVKVADFGLAEDMHNTNYFRPDKSSDDMDTKLPIRWMSLESIKEGLFTEKSDVVRIVVTHAVISETTVADYNQLSLVPSGIHTGLSFDMKISFIIIVFSLFFWI